ncbi:MAG: hypothetical protein HQK50_16255 [Oligoflexia bacterium]|nr:hypothetical protein [Oligoflexia bacterium]MBF0367129.1 hypothetical protein [Oligoflexia bacterium]
MNSITWFYILLLLVDGLVAYFIFAKQTSFTALIPALFALILFLWFYFASEQYNRIGLIVISVLLLLGCFPGVIKWVALMRGELVARPLAIQVQAITALIVTAYLVVMALFPRLK